MTAVLFPTYEPFNASSVSDTQWQRFAGYFRPDGVAAGYLNMLKVVPNATGGRVVTVGTGGAWIQGTYGEQTVTQNVTLQPNTSGNDRWDLIVVAQVTNGAVPASYMALDVVQGTAAASPTLPTVTQTFGSNYQIPLAYVYCANGYTTIATTEIFDARTISEVPTTFSKRQLLVNGGLELWQRLAVASSWASTNDYTADRWRIKKPGTDTITVSREATNVMANSKYSLKAIYGVGSLTADVHQDLKLTTDNMYWLLGQPVAFRCSVKLSTAVSKACRPFITVDGTGGATYYGVYHSPDTNWQTIDVPAVVVPTDCTTLTVGLVFEASVTAYLDNCILNQGYGPLVYQALTPSEELERAQRYYEIIAAGNDQTFNISGWCANNPQVNTYWIPFNTAKCVAPTITRSGMTLSAGTTDNTSNASLYGFRYVLTATTAGAPFSINNAGATDYLVAESNP